MRRLDDAGLPFVINAVEDAALAMEAAQLTGAPHVVLFHKNAWSGAPNYALSPAQAAAARWQKVRELMPPELEPLKKRIIFEVTIEPDKARSDWVGNFMVSIATLAAADGYRIGGPSFSTGEPEPEHWRTPGMLAWLRYLATYDDAALTTHEYSLDAGNIQTGAPWLIGRYQQVYDACDEAGIARPRVIIAEAGWAHNAMPDDAMPQIAWLAQQYDGVACCLWTLGGGSQWGNLPQRLSAYVGSVTDWLLANSTPEEEEEGPPMATLEGMLWETGLQRQVLSIYSKAALGKAIYADGLVPMSPEFDVAHGGVTYRGQRAGALTSDLRRVYFCRVPEWGVVWHIDGPEPLYSSPVGTIAERASGVIWPGAWVDANVYGNRYRLGAGWSVHTGADLNLNVPAWNADKGMPVHAISHGVVTYARRVPAGTWGRLVVVRHETPDGARHSRYGHLASMLVQEGQAVRRGDVLGTIGGAEFGLADHLHFDISHSGILQSNPTHWPGDNLPAVRAHYLPPKAFLESQGKVDAGVEPPPTPAIDMLPYLRGDGRLYEVRNAAGGQERCQSQNGPGTIFYQTKNSNWEQLDFDDAYIYRDVDTSPGGGRYYRLLEDGRPGSRWIPRHWRPGETYTRSRRVQFYRLSDCVAVPENSGDVTDTMRFVARYASYTFRTGITLPDVVRLEWVNGGEVYLYARGVGLCGWERLHQDPHTPQWSAISELHAPGSRPDNVRQAVGCL